MLLKNKFLAVCKFVLILILTIGCNSSNFEFKEGDILFQDLDKDAIDNAIEKVTKTNLAYNFTHVGIVVKQQDTLKVLEAISTGVQLTDIEVFLNRNLIKGKPKVVVGELKPEFKPMLSKAIEHGKSLIGLPYDAIYIIGDNSYYCSELLYEMFHYSNPNNIPFKLNPMTFKDPKTNETLTFWLNYYAELNHEIPEGELGLNPNGMSVSPNIVLVYDFLKKEQLR
ncbi:Permuted papain-like amidase enzyme, YaeF/YiiX, C92 family [Lutibacter agarilyticus]|uniref:Permuted papain-like amidase enzyme, YaeF/YiiX, C92 family n=1 Tax=Lutibacter agarilyticus TaxID=1109740 RepID=A0A238XGR2_9FLAO|nr:YiiX/YebB-like N1pC/P60 family cysteine hydrolase [Lutibacter agarilyticus]SNR57099.1 Permuted papain-like amidase enzyme, YaeF/YiiX, C92 family [Lutibacter agarilyticus]